LRFPRAIAAAVARTRLHLFSEGKAKCGFLLFLSSSEFSRLEQLEAFNQINVGVHSATRPDDQGRQPVLLSSSSKILYFSGELPAARACRVPGWKAVLDITCILFLLPLWLPLMMLLMLVTRIASPGPIFYRQKRVGLCGRHFFIWKFRTMRLSAETQTHERYLENLMRVDSPMTKLDAHGDPRLAPFGRVLRASGLDELPQIFNVLRGEMSLVGPRPCTPNEFAHYEPWQRQRVNCLPGLTGYWQVNGKNKTTFREMIALDLFYLKNLSILLDLKIMFKTCAVIAGQLVESRPLTQHNRQDGAPCAPATILQSLAESAQKSPRSATTILQGFAESAPK
jgi:lipopolysaccharide/colanic/teichoic acid biosynthesis glycosyltransferase